jgi:hypothetical protein
MAPRPKEDELEELPEQMGPLAPLPQFPRSNPRPNRPATPAAENPSLEEPPLPPALPARPAESSAPPGTGISTTASIDRAAEPVEVADPADIQAAIAQAVDIGFVGVGQLMGQVDRRARGLEATDPKWVPTVQERKFVADPAARIAKRHLKIDATALDTVDLLLIGVGVGGFTIRRATGVDPLEAPE